MGEFLKVIIPLFGAGLLPVWIPLLGAAVGAVGDRLHPDRINPVEAMVNEIKAQSAAAREAARAAAHRCVETADRSDDQLAA